MRYYTLKYPNLIIPKTAIGLILCKIGVKYQYTKESEGNNQCIFLSVTEVVLTSVVHVRGGPKPKLGPEHNEL